MSEEITHEYSKRLGVLSYNQFQAALDYFDLGTLVRAEKVPFGNSGQAEVKDLHRCSMVIISSFPNISQSRMPAIWS